MNIKVIGHGHIFVWGVKRQAMRSCATNAFAWWR